MFLIFQYTLLTAFGQERLVSYLAVPYSLSLIKHTVCNVMILPAAAGQLSAGRAEREVHRQDRERLLAERRREDQDQATGQDARALGGTLQQPNHLG